MKEDNSSVVKCLTGYASTYDIYHICQISARFFNAFKSREQYTLDLFEDNIDIPKILRKNSWRFKSKLLKKV